MNQIDINKDKEDLVEDGVKEGGIKQEAHDREKNKKYPRNFYTRKAKRSRKT